MFLLNDYDSGELDLYVTFTIQNVPIKLKRSGNTYNL